VMMSVKTPVEMSKSFREDVREEFCEEAREEV